MSRPFVSAVALIVGLFIFLLGVWAFVSPHSFFDQLATWQPYNKHFLHDVGAFQMGLGSVLVLAIFVKDSMLLALSGTSVGFVMHAVAHAIDSGKGGKSTDPYLLGVLALIVVVAAILRARAISGTRAPS